jgi:hypothetical protein
LGIFGRDQKMSEKQFSKYLKKILGDKVFYDRIECITKTGIPDVFYYIKPNGPPGVLELKFIESFPKKGGLISLKHLTDEQIFWMNTRGAIIKRAFVFLKIEETFNLIRWNHVHRFKKFPKHHLALYASMRWYKKINPEELIKELSK